MEQRHNRHHSAIPVGLHIDALLLRYKQLCTASNADLLEYFNPAKEANIGANNRCTTWKKKPTANVAQRMTNRSFKFLYSSIGIQT
eukprot:scaffold1383_cov360-Prasinococcus_capsulatus_cf.AAC.14